MIAISVPIRLSDPYIIGRIGNAFACLYWADKMKTDNVAAITMVYGDAFIEKWVEHYAAQVGRSNLFVISHGDNPLHRQVCEGLNHIVLPRVFDATFENARANLINRFANGLLSVYRAVIFTDVDEFISVDPSRDQTLGVYLRSLDTKVVAPVAFNVLADDGSQDIDWTRPILEQANIMRYAPFFCKPCIRFEPVEHNWGAHALKNSGTFEVDPNLLMFHLKYIDAKLWGRYSALETEMNEETRSAAGMAGWQRSDVKRMNAYRRIMDGLEELDPRHAVEGRTEVERVRNVCRVKRDQRRPDFRLPAKYRHLV